MKPAGIVLLLAFVGFAQAETSLDAMERAIRSGEFKKITSVVVSRGGKIVYERYFEGDAGTLRNTRSATKTITGMLFGIAVERRIISSVNAPVMPFLAGKQFKNPDPLKEAISIEDLLTMNSALDCNDWVDKSPGNEEGMYPQQDWVKFALDLPVRSTRGFSYCTAGVVTLGAVLERAAGVAVPEFARKNLFEPLGIAATPRSGQSFGLGFMVRTQRGEHPTLGEPGEFYWQGAWGTAFFIDPKKKLVAVLMLQVPLLQAPHYQSLFHNLVHQALIN